MRSVIVILVIFLFLSCSANKPQPKRLDIISCEIIHLERGGLAMSVFYLVDGTAQPALLCSREEADRFAAAFESFEKHNLEVYFESISICFRPDIKSGGR